MRVKLTPAFVASAKLAPKADGTLPDRTIYWDQSQPGFGLMVTAAGHRSYVCQYRVRGTSRRLILKSVLSLGAARKEAKVVLGAAARGQDPLAERREAEASADDTLRSIVESFFGRYLRRDGTKLRTADERLRTFERLVFKKFGARQIGDIKRIEITKLLDKIEDEHGPRMATLTLAYLRKVMNWHASRSGDFRSPRVQGMARGTVGKRERTLTGDELRALWRAAEGWDHPFARMLRFILLTAVRRNEAAKMRRSEVQGDIWTIPALRYKTAINFELPLSRAALSMVENSPKKGREGFMFTTDGEAGLAGYTKFKAEFDRRMLAELRKAAAERGEDSSEIELTPWVIHDLRRTARSLMSDAGVPPDHAERCLGHKMPAIRGTYDRYDYNREKLAAFEALAAQMRMILDPVPNVVPLRPGKAG
jgi:integrase